MSKIEFRRGCCRGYCSLRPRSLRPLLSSRPCRGAGQPRIPAVPCSADEHCYQRWPPVARHCLRRRRPSQRQRAPVLLVLPCVDTQSHRWPRACRTCAAHVQEPCEHTCLRRRAATARASTVSRQPSARTSLQPRMLVLAIALTWRPCRSRAYVPGGMRTGRRAYLRRRELL